MDNKEFAKVLLCEATELLNEAAAANARKDIAKNTKSIKKDPRVKMFFKGKLSKDEADKLYRELDSKLKVIEEKISSIPKETTGEIVSSYILSAFTKDGVLIGFIVEVVGCSIENDAAKSVVKSVVELFGFDYLRKTNSGERNWNKAVCEKAISSLRYKLNKAYNKYYVEKSQNESIAILLTEAALLLND